MSYIYEALKRAQKENERGDVLPRARARSGVLAGRSRWWLWAVIAVLAVNVVVLAAVVVRDRPAPPAAVAVSAAPQAPIVDSTVKDPVAPLAAPAPASAPPAPVRVTRPLPRVKAADAVAPRVPTPRVAPEVPTRPSAPSVGPASTPVAAPKMTLQVIVYSDIPAQRMVFIEGRRYVEGDSVDAETVLERISADGVVMKRRGERFVISERRP